MQLFDPSKFPPYQAPDPREMAANVGEMGAVKPINPHQPVELAPQPPPRFTRQGTMGMRPPPGGNPMLSGYNPQLDMMLKALKGQQQSAE